MSEPSSTGAATAAQSNLPVGAQLSVAMLKKSNEVMEQQAQSLVKLVDSMPKPGPVGSLGHNLDVMA